jgi:hypothetical protein
MGVFCQMASSIGSAVAMFSTFPEDARWNPEREAVEFGVEIGEWSGSRGACFSGSCPSGHPPSGASKPTTYSGAGSRASISRNCAGGS